MQFRFQYEPGGPDLLAPAAASAHRVICADRRVREEEVDSLHVNSGQGLWSFEQFDEIKKSV